MKQITEGMNVHKEWYEKAKSVKLEELPDFINSLMNDYSHDYGTICHALAAGGIATMWAMNKHEQGGITGFQAGCIMWQFIREWNCKNNKTGLKMVDYDNMLFPQYEHKFEKTIDQSTWESIQKEAVNHINEADKDYEKYLKDIEQYKVDIENYVKKYPDYYENRKYYDRLGSGTGKEWDAYYEKEKSGFEFAPNEPFCCVNKDGGVYKHWQSIINGVIPFGYEIAED